MDPFVLLLGIVAFAPVFLVLRELHRQQQPRYFEKVAVVVKRPEALDQVARVIGRYMGVDIYEQIIFHGVTYIYDRVAPPAYKSFMRARELYLEPGLVYRAVPLCADQPRLR